ncbi:MAG: YegP family protein [Verrucomicrobiota bacterium]
MFEIFQGKSKDFRFRLKAGNGQIILTSEGYTSKKSCLTGIESVRKNSQSDDRFKTKEGKNGKFHFNLTARNGEIIGSSQMYKTPRTMQTGIDSVKKNAPESGVKDLTA